MYTGRQRGNGRGRTPRALVDSVAGVSRFAVAAVTMMLAWTLLPLAVGWSSQVVMSGSMTPRIAIGDVVVTQPVDAAGVRPGQVVLVADPTNPGRLLLHRVVERRPDGSLITRGDANRTPDSTPVPPQNVRGLARLRIPYVGLPAVWFRQGNYLLVVATLLMLGAAVYGSTIPARASTGDPDPAGPPTRRGRTNGCGERSC